MVQRSDDHAASRRRGYPHAVDSRSLHNSRQGRLCRHISRGSVIDQAALGSALTDKTIAGAGLEFF